MNKSEQISFLESHLRDLLFVKYVNEVDLPVRRKESFDDLGERLHGLCKDIINSDDDVCELCLGGVDVNVNEEKTFDFDGDSYEFFVTVKKL